MPAIDLTEDDRHRARREWEVQKQRRLLAIRDAVDSGQSGDTVIELVSSASIAFSSEDRLGAEPQ
jgi:hypothetical protein